MGVGTNRINKYTLGKNTQGISNYLKKVYPNEELKVVIAYDCRHNSDTLAKTVADVFSANGIKVYLFSDLRTTPALSFSVKHLTVTLALYLQHLITHQNIMVIKYTGQMADKLYLHRTKKLFQK